jgi:hypothetical protein
MSWSGVQHSHGTVFIACATCSNNKGAVFMSDCRVIPRFSRGYFQDFQQNAKNLPIIPPRKRRLVLFRAFLFPAETLWWQLLSHPFNYMNIAKSCWICRKRIWCFYPLKGPSDEFYSWGELANLRNRCVRTAESEGRVYSILKSVWSPQ